MVHWEATFHNLKCILGFYIHTYIAKYVPQYVYTLRAPSVTAPSVTAPSVTAPSVSRVNLPTSTSSPRHHHPGARHTNYTYHTKYNATYY